MYVRAAHKDYLEVDPVVVSTSQRFSVSFERVIGRFAEFVRRSRILEGV